MIVRDDIRQNFELVVINKVLVVIHVTGVPHVEQGTLPLYMKEAGTGKEGKERVPWNTSRA